MKIKNKQKKVDDRDTITLVLKHNPLFQDPAQKITSFCQDLAHTTKIKASNSKVPRIINARKQPLNLLRMLSLSKKRDHTITNNNNVLGTFTKCGNTRCLFCYECVISDTTYTTKNGTILKRKVEMNCKTMDLIYCLICLACGEEYIGETGCTIAERTNLHRSQITNDKYRKMKVSKHIHECSCNKFKIFPFYKCNQQSHIYREEIEKKFRIMVCPSLH